MNSSTINFLNNIRNSIFASNKKAQFFSNKLTLKLVEILYKKGYILSYKQIKTNNFVKIQIVFKDKNMKNLFSGLKICSSSSRKVFLSLNQISKIEAKNKLFLFSTNKGILDCKDCKKNKIGGILLFYC